MRSVALSPRTITFMSYPYRNPRVQVDLPQPEPDSRLLLNHETGRYLRLGLREFDWLTRLDGQLHVREVALAFGQEQTLVEELLRRLAGAKLICYSEEPVSLQPLHEVSTPPAQPRRIEWPQFGQLRIHLGQPKALLDRLTPVTRALMSKPLVATGLLVSLLGIILAGMQGSELAATVRSFPWSVWQTLIIIALVFTTTFIHELGHAVVCDYYGAPVRSLGIMVYYLQPAAYADVTDSWQLKNRWHRVVISAAGIYVQAIVSSVALICWTLWHLLGHNGGSILVMFVALNAAIMIFNFLPFVKLDGYWMLTNMIGVANLRDRALEWLRVSARSAVTRRPVDPTRMRFNAVLSMPPLDRSLLGFFGMTCVLFGMSMWTGGLAFLFRVTRWFGMRSSVSMLAVAGTVVALVVSYVVSLFYGARKSRAAGLAATRPGETVSAAVRHHIDPLRPIRLNPHVSALDNGDGAVTFGWSTPDALTVRVPSGFFEALPMLRSGSATLHELKQSDVWNPEVEQAIQRLWHDRHVRYSTEWELAEENVRYSRQLGWLSMNSKARGKESEVLSKLRNSSVTVLGVGGLGTHVAWNLAACGVGELHLVDGDTIELSNLNRQLFYTPADIGLRKVDVAAERLQQFNPEMRIRKTHGYLQSIDDIAGVIEGSDFVVRAIDSPLESMAWVNEACIDAGIPFSGAGFFPQGTIVGPTVIPGQTACLACNAPATAPRFDRGTGGTLAPLVFTTAGILASETINFLGKLGSIQTAGRMLTINAPALNFTFSDVPRNENCPLCGREERMSA